jgi:hypothetical protein
MTYTYYIWVFLSFVKIVWLQVMVYLKAWLNSESEFHILVYGITDTRVKESKEPNVTKRYFEANRLLCCISKKIHEQL